jgi:hypothetical protein
MHNQQIEHIPTRAPQVVQIDEFIKDMYSEQAALLDALESRADTTNPFAKLVGAIAVRRRESRLELTQKALLNLDQRLAIPMALGEFSTSDSFTE